MIEMTILLAVPLLYEWERLGCDGKLEQLLIIIMVHYLRASYVLSWKSTIGRYYCFFRIFILKMINKKIRR